ncbi:hypothetical protein ACQU0X_26415 [Pseudovibrio ascidiaceicola]|uniref:hypothetical protein n=1 Tax=Pseudovibrio ascidiaceicola TaxID=285279 RepID=UPI003D35F51E
MNNFALNVVKPDLSTGEVYLRVRKEIMPPEPDGSSAGSVLEYELPIAFDVIQNVCRIYGDSAYLGERRLVSVLVDNALQAYENLIYRTNSLESTQAMRLAVFVSSLVTQIAEVSKCRIKCASGGMWNPLFGSSLEAFCRGNSGPFSWHQASLPNVDEYKVLTYRDITTRKVTRLLLRNEYEQAVCMGDVGAFTPDPGYRDFDTGELDT